MIEVCSLYLNVGVLAYWTKYRLGLKGWYIMLSHVRCGCSNRIRPSNTRRASNRSRGSNSLVLIDAWASIRCRIENIVPYVVFRDARGTFVGDSIWSQITTSYAFMCCSQIGDYEVYTSNKCSIDYQLTVPYLTFFALLKWVCKSVLGPKWPATEVPRTKVIE